MLYNVSAEFADSLDLATVENIVHKHVPYGALSTFSVDASLPDTVQRTAASRALAIVESDVRKHMPGGRGHSRFDLLCMRAAVLRVD